MRCSVDEIIREIPTLRLMAFKRKHIFADIMILIERLRCLAGTLNTYCVQSLDGSRTNDARPHDGVVRTPCGTTITCNATRHCAKLIAKRTSHNDELGDENNSTAESPKLD